MSCRTNRQPEHGADRAADEHDVARGDHQGLAGVRDADPAAGGADEAGEDQDDPAPGEVPGPDRDAEQSEDREREARPEGQLRRQVHLRHRRQRRCRGGWRRAVGGRGAAGGAQSVRAASAGAEPVARAGAGSVPNGWSGSPGSRASGTLGGRSRHGSVPDGPAFPVILGSLPLVARARRKATRRDDRWEDGTDGPGPGHCDRAGGGRRLPVRGREAPGDGRWPAAPPAHARPPGRGRHRRRHRGPRRRRRRGRGGDRVADRAPGRQSRARNAAWRARSRSVEPPWREGTDAVLIALGDQPTVRTGRDPRAPRRARGPGARRSSCRRYADDRRPQPGAGRSAGFALLDEASGDRGLGRSSPRTPSGSRRCRVAGSNPDVDTPADLVGVLEAAWAARVRANREQVDRLREVPDGPDFYAPVTGAVPGRPGADRRAGARRAAGAGAARRDVARHRRGRRPLRAAGRARPSRRRAGRSWPSTRRAGCWTRCGRTRRRHRSGTSGCSRAVAARRDPAAVRRGCRADGARRLRHRGHRPVPGGDGGGHATTGRRGADGAPAGVGRRRMLAAGPRRVADRVAGAPGVRGAAPRDGPRARGPAPGRGSRGGSRPAPSSRGSCAASCGSSPGARGPPVPGRARRADRAGRDGGRAGLASGRCRSASSPGARASPSGASRSRSAGRGTASSVRGPRAAARGPSPPVRAGASWYSSLSVFIGTGPGGRARGRLRRCAAHASASVRPSVAPSRVVCAEDPDPSRSGRHRIRGPSGASNR